MVIRLHYHRFLHGQLGSLLDRLSVGDAHHVVGRPVEAVQDQVLAHEQFRRHDLLSTKSLHRGEVLSVRFFYKVEAA